MSHKWVVENAVVLGELLILSQWWKPGKAHSAISEGICSDFDWVNESGSRREGKAGNGDEEGIKGWTIFLLNYPLSFETVPEGDTHSWGESSHNS